MQICLTKKKKKSVPSKSCPLVNKDSNNMDLISVLFMSYRDFCFDAVFYCQCGQGHLLESLLELLQLIVIAVSRKKITCQGTNYQQQQLSVNYVLCLLLAKSLATSGIGYSKKILILSLLQSLKEKDVSGFCICSSDYVSTKLAQLNALKRECQYRIDTSGQSTDKQSTRHLISSNY